jgi:hypothetical protein
MAIDRGKQYEYAIIKSAYSKIKSPSSDITSKLAMIQTKSIESIVQSAADSMLSKIIGNMNDFYAQQVYKSFRQLGGSSPEPKTDVLFVKSGTKYKCSMKWGSSYQLSSSGISGTVSVLDKVLRKVVSGGGMGMDINALGEIALVLEQASNIASQYPTRQEKNTIKPILDRIKGSGGLNEELQRILGSRKNTNIGESYVIFKREVVRESLTGNLTFGASSDKSANYILNESELKKIDDSLVNSIADKTYIDMRLKGRGKTAEGVRLNEIVVRIEPTG